MKEKKEAREYIQNLNSAMLQYYGVFGVKKKPLREELQLSDYYIPSEQKKTGELLFVMIGTAITSYMIIKYI